MFDYISRQTQRNRTGIDKLRYDRLRYIVGKACYGFVCTSKQVAFQGSIVNSSWKLSLALISFYLDRREEYQRAALTWMLVALHLKLNRDVATLIGKMVYDARG